MATKTTKDRKGTKAEKFIKFVAADHTRIKIQAAMKGKTMGEYLASLARKDSEGK